MAPRDMPSAAVLEAFVEAVGRPIWSARIAAIEARGAVGPRSLRAAQQRHALELAIERLRGQPGRAPNLFERRVAMLAAATVREFGRLGRPGRRRLREALGRAMVGENSLVPVFHLMRTAALQRSRGFEVAFAGLKEDAPFDLLLTRDGQHAEVACETVSAEEGRDLHRVAWLRLADRIDPDLQTWLAAHPGRYLLKMTLPQGLRDASLAGLHERICLMLSGERRAEHDEAAVLRLDPLLVAAAQADELGLLSSLRDQFGPEAHLSVTAAGRGVFVMAARAGRENAVAAAVRRRMNAMVPARLTGKRPGILAMFIEDTDRVEWRGLRERLELEGEARQFLTHPEARRVVVAVTCASRLELFGVGEPDGAPGGELRFRNPAHPHAKAPALAAAVASSM